MAPTERSTFIALPVACGDAFYLRRPAKSILIDGGKSTNAFPGIFTNYTSSTHVDLLVCTHNDADHANGVLGFLRSELTCSELWLPGTWLDALPRLLRPFETVFEDLLFEPELTEMRDVGRAEPHEDDLRLNGWPQSVALLLEEAPVWPTATFTPYVFMLRAVPDSHRGPWVEMQALIAAGQRIRDIAIQAVQRGLPVRWFEHAPASPGGGTPGILEPLSSKAKTRVAPSSRTLREHLRLTTVNKESLVFWAPQHESSPGVLFCADSDFEGIQSLPLVANTIVTAPHHGAESNASVYLKVDPNKSENVTWVRSDSHTAKRPCSAYKARANRYCTLCSGAAGPQKSLGFVSGSGVWQPTRSTLRCTCQP